MLFQDKAHEDGLLESLVLQPGYIYVHLLLKTTEKDCSVCVCVFST